MGAVSPATRHRPPRPRALRRRRLVNRLNLTTALGLAIARLGRAEVREGPDGLLLAEGYRLPLPIAGAFTIGNVVTTPTTFAGLEEATPGVLAHESRHAWQYYRLGLAFFPVYAAAASWSWARYGDPAVGNAFERHAGLVTGGYLPSALVTPRASGPLASLRIRRGRPPRGAGPSGSPDAATAADGDA